MKIQAWVDSEANIHSKREFTIQVDEEDWDEMAPDERDNLVQEEVMQRISWGYDAPKP